MPDSSQNSTRLSLPYIQPAQAQKHVTHNEALRRLDALVQLSVASDSATAPPATAPKGARYILPEGATGGWAGQTGGTLAVFEENAWQFYTAQTGWRAWVEDLGALRVFDGSAWRAEATPDYQNLPQVGINTSSDTTNRLAVAANATLLTHTGAGHQLKLNKASPGDTASLLFQTGWSGRAEIGTTGGEDFEIKVSADGSTFHSALVAEAASGKVSFPQGAAGLAPAQFGDGPLLTTGYAAARGTDLVTNGTGLLGNGYNYPAEFTYDPAVAPNLPASFSYTGHYTSPQTMQEFLPLDPNRVYRLSSYLCQEGLAGDWSDWAEAERHRHYMGLICYDQDGLIIQSQHHMRYHHASTDSLTTLAAPLAPGDTVVYLNDSSGWNESSTAGYDRGVILFGYRNTFGYAYDRYSRLVGSDLFDLGDVDKTTDTVTLNKALPAALGNPDAASGIWPQGSVIANSARGGAYKYAFYSALIPPESDHWYRTKSYIGGIDRSGLNISDNFSPGTAYTKLFWLPNYSNRTGGYSGHPDTGSAHRVWFSGISVTPEPLAMVQATSTGAQEIKVPQGDFTAGTLSLAPATFQIEPV